MAANRRRSLSIDVLEERTVPAVSLRFLGGNLYLRGDNTANVLTLTNTGGINLNVNNNTTDLGTYAVTGNVTVVMGNAADTVNVDLATGTLPGSLSITTGNGADAVSVDNGSVGGLSTLISTGNGDDAVVIGLNGPVNIGSTVVNVNGGLGNDSLVVLDASQVAGTLVAVNVNSIQLGDGTNTAQFTDVVAANQAETQASSFFLVNGSVVAGDLTYSGGNLSDVVFLDGDIGGNATVIGGEGANSLGVNFAGGPSTIGGNLTYVGGGGADDVSFSLSGAGNTNINGSVSLYMGNGDNTYFFLNAFTVGGNMTILAGGGLDDVGSVDGTVGGNLTVNLGAGGTVGTPQGINLVSTAVVGGNFNYTGGSGEDAVTVGGTVGGDVVANLGAGADTFTWDATALVGGANIDFGLDFDPDVYVQNIAVITWDQTLTHLP